MSASKKKKSNRNKKKSRKNLNKNVNNKVNLKNENNSDKQLIVNENIENNNTKTDEEKKNFDDKKNQNDEIDVKEKKKNEISEQKNEDSKTENIENKKDQKNIIENSKAEDKEKENIPPKKIFLGNLRKKLYIFACFVVIILIIMVFSTCFAIININSNTIAKGVSIKNIDVSGLTIQEANNKINEAMKLELIPEISLKYSDSYEITLKPEQIDFQYKVGDIVNKAYNIGREGNIIVNNYSLILTSFLGKNLEISYAYNEELLNKFVDDINSKIPGIVIQPTYYIEDNKMIVTKGTDGIGVKKDQLKNEILEKIISRTVDEVKKENYIQVIEIPTENVKADKIDMFKIYSEIHTEPKDAYFETEPYKIYPDVDGVDLEISVEDAQNLVNAEDKEEYSFDLKITKAQKTINDLGAEAFPYLISSFSTNYVASNVNRSTNLKIAAQKINGKVLLPGEEFSFNQVVGKRTVEEGYKDAQIYADGGVVDGLAGGICQISSTLYNAVLLANLQITERRNHSYTTSYLEAGKDATVVWGTIDFKFINSRSYPIKIESSVEGGVATFKIHGIKEETEYEVKILPVKTQSIPYTTSYIQDPTLAPGQQVVSQAGHPGYKVTTYKELLLNGSVVSKEVITNDTYSPMRTIIRIGPVVPVVGPTVP